MPGQFVMVWIPGVDEKPFSISACEEGRVELTIKAVGPFSSRLVASSPGTLLGLRGPFGHGFELLPRTLLLGGGMGMAPMRFLLRELARAGLPHKALFGARTAADVPFGEEFSQASEHRDGQAGAAVTLVTEDGGLGRKGKVTDGLAEELASGRWNAVCACGPEGMLEQVGKLCRAARIRCLLSFERYMKCAIGICGTCCLQDSGLRVCKEGPVIDTSDGRDQGKKSPPRWCDLSCEHAEFPKTEAIDGSGSCRTFLALWCRKLGEHVTKNSKCRATYTCSP
jgi:dihydroorotate dehydrogenase electron transfer subunit